MPTPDLTATRDRAVIAGAITVIGALAYALIDDLRLRPARKPADAGKRLYRSNHGGLYVVGQHYEGTPQARYVRPASEAELGASQIAADIDGGPGVFGVVKDGDGIRYVLPGTAEWETAIIPSFTASPTYYRVEPC